MFLFTHQDMIQFDFCIFFRWLVQPPTREVLLGDFCLRSFDTYPKKHRDSRTNRTVLSYVLHKMDWRFTSVYIHWICPGRHWNGLPIESLFLFGAWLVFSGLLKVPTQCAVQCAVGTCQGFQSNGTGLISERQVHVVNSMLSVFVCVCACVKSEHTTRNIWTSWPIQKLPPDKEILSVLFCWFVQKDHKCRCLFFRFVPEWFEQSHLFFACRIAENPRNRRLNDSKTWTSNNELGSNWRDYMVDLWPKAHGYVEGWRIFGRMVN